jgi:hypothetical protein
MNNRLENTKSQFVNLNQEQLDQEFLKDLERVVNRHCRENLSDTPDFILAEYAMKCMKAFDEAVTRREAWYGRTQVGTVNIEGDK